ncbi:FAD-dependent oxidoreductase [Priestia megaterium]|uniref:FAD-dependent oxidoreductase n=1 Tax=Priestia megaterium TaxID=1404 RepID=UPI0035DCA50A
MNKKKKVLVIGAGVSGLTTAMCLRKKGFEVTIVAEKFAPDITSVVAGALWEWPPAVCGYHHDLISLERSKDWCMTSYRIFSELAKNKETGVHMRTVSFYFKHLVKDNEQDFMKLNELKDKVDEFRHDVNIIEENEVNTQIGLKDAYSHLAPMVDTDTYMVWLLKEVKEAGCEVISKRLEGYILEQEVQLKKEYGVDAIVNCAGLGSIELANEYMYPLRGALIRVNNDGTSFPKITQAHCISHDESKDEQDIIFIVPRGENMLVLGGLAEPDEWSLDIGLDNYQPVKEMFDRCTEFLPILKDAQLDLTEPVRVGLRPFRRENVRLEQEKGTSIIHNYGHGGAGITFSWGCALEVAEKIEGLISDKSNHPPILSSTK